MSTFFRRPLARVSLVTLVVLGIARIGAMALVSPQNDDSEQIAGIEREGDIPLPVA